MSVVLPALQERVLDNCDDDTQGDFRGHEAQTKDDELPAVKRRRRSHWLPPPIVAQEPLSLVAAAEALTGDAESRTVRDLQTSAATHIE